MCTSAVTLFCTAAFAAGSSALLCILFLSNQPNGHILGIQTHVNCQLRCDGRESQHENRNSFVRVRSKDNYVVARGSTGHNGRRSVTPITRQVVDSAALDSMESDGGPGVVWLMVCKHSLLRQHPMSLMIFSHFLLLSVWFCSPFLIAELATHFMPSGN